MQVNIWECKWMQVPSTWWGRQKSFPSRKSRASDISYRSRRGQQPLHWGWSRCCRQPTCTGLPAHPGSPSGPGFKRKKKKKDKIRKKLRLTLHKSKISTYRITESLRLEETFRVIKCNRLPISTMPRELRNHWGWKRPSTHPHHAS